MARTRRDPAAAEDLGRRLTALHDKLDPSPSFDGISRMILLTYSFDVKGEQVRKYHRGEIDPHTAQTDELLALLLFYGAKPSDLGPVAAERLGHAIDLANKATPHQRRRSTKRYEVGTFDPQHRAAA